MSKWEYLEQSIAIEGGKVIKNPDKSLNELGAEGWELIDVNTISQIGTPVVVSIRIFKRELL